VLMPLLMRPRPAAQIEHLTWAHPAEDRGFEPHAIRVYLRLNDSGVLPRTVANWNFMPGC
ncbi:hypothetical protein, partial [Nocardia sp. NPDC059228]|uniref:hypothetical protein n=1 Tax=Nocardia sp. NPDC059228 TaxID=3346777 RepID=UPI00369D5780